MKIAIIYYIAFLVMATLLIFYVLQLPIVYWSVSQNECVKIIIKGEVHSCEILPTIDKYEKVWVE